MKNLTKYSIIVFCAFLWFLGCSRETVVKLVDNGIIKDDYRYGDLYRLSNLSEFRVKAEKCDKAFSGQKTNVALFLAGDSFSEEGRVPADQYASKTYFRTFVADKNHNLPEFSGKKILLIETVERHLRERFSDQVWENWLRKGNEEIQVPKVSLSLTSVYDAILNMEVPYREEMHESVLFSSDFMLKIKELKAAFNYNILGKTDPKVKILENELVYSLDIEPGVSSIYDEVSDEEISRIVSNANLTRQKYLDMGFDEVYLSIIPNKSSPLAQKDPKYNRLIERVENHASLEIPIISVWEEFKKGNFYQKGDSHWTCQGQKIWVDKVNVALKKI